MTPVEGNPVDRTALRPVPAWASGTGLIELNPHPDQVEPGLRAQLQERAHRYCWGFDERRIDVLTGCFTEDAVWRGDVMGETAVGPFTGRPEILRYLTTFWPHQKDQRRHILSNFIVETAQERAASALCYLQLMGSRDAASRLEITGLYSFRYRLDGDTWRICALTAGFDAPFWKRPVATMRPEIRERFGVLDAPTGTVPR